MATHGVATYALATLTCAFATKYDAYQSKHLGTFHLQYLQRYGPRNTF